jgi:hypothetical protein
MRCLWLPLLAWIAAGLPARAEPDPRRAFKPLRDDESWAWLRAAPTEDRDFWDPVKYLPLSKRRPDLYLTFGAEIRLWAELFENEQWGSTGHARDGSLLQRYMLHADLHLTRSLRTFVQLKSGVASFRLDGPRPPDQDLLDFNQLYLDVNLLPGATIDDEAQLVLRGGRQEMSYGSGRLIDVREGPNVRASFDGLRLIARPGPVRIDGFVVRPAQTRPGVFDDGWDATQWLWGLYSALKLPALTAEAYYLGRQRDMARYEHAAGPELRHTTGTRLRGKLRAFELEIEAAYQFGSVGERALSAFTVAGEAVFHATSAFLKPRVVLGGGVTSGDSGRGGALGTFSALFPKGAYFGLFSPNGPANNFAPHGALQLSLPASVTLLAEVWGFFRYSLSDGVYSVPGSLLRAGATNPERYLGTQLETWVTWQASRHLSTSGTFGHYWTGGFFAASTPGEDITYAAVWLTYKL